MRYLVLSDLHANLEAFDAVMAAVSRDDYDRSLVLGDIVGYGADPNAVVDRVRALAPDVAIRGNHDKVASGMESADGFNQAAKYAAMWTLDQLSNENRDYLAGLPPGPLEIDDVLQICHGSPDDEDEYIFEPVDAVEALRGLSRPLCMFGHTHVPIGYWLSVSEFDLIVPDATRVTRIDLQPGRRYMVNPGSVGQPRDGDPRAAYAIVDTEALAVTLYRVDYDVAAAQRKILDAQLPEGLARRLGLGK